MDAYEYVVRNDADETVKGVLWGESEREIALRLKRDGFRIYRINRKEKSKVQSWSHEVVADITYQLGLLIESGVPLRRALHLLCNGRRALVYRALYESIERGQPLSQAFRNEGCPPIALALLESGEASGTLGESLRYISHHYEWERQLRQKIISAISYPAFLLVLMNLFFFVTVLFIIPSFQKVFETMYIELPMMTRALFALGQGLKDHPTMAIGIHFLGAVCILWGYKQNRIRHAVHRRLWQLAHRHQWLTCMYYTSMLKIWALLLEAGLSIIQTVEITQPLWPNLYGRECSEYVKKELLSGHSLYESLEAAHIGNTFIWQMVSIGEESGELVTMLNHCGRYYELIMAKYIGRLERLLEPILLTVMGIGVAVLVVSVMYPLFTSISSLSGY